MKTNCDDWTPAPWFTNVHQAVAMEMLALGFLQSGDFSQAEPVVTAAHGQLTLDGKWKETNHELFGRLLFILRIYNLHQFSEHDLGFIAKQFEGILNGIITNQLGIWYFGCFRKYGISPILAFSRTTLWTMGFRIYRRLSDKANVIRKEKEWHESHVFVSICYL